MIVGIVVGGALVLFLLKRYFNGGVNKYSEDLNGKVVIVTGSNCGIGYETAVELGKEGATLVMACRDMMKGQKAKETLLKQINGNTNIHLMQLDLGD
jgi:NAD(P)-dependent dehydrogenase (short-subunit alcohol dehydrogenase family)